MIAFDMAQPIPRWLMEKYATLFRKFKGKEFTFQQAMETINEKDKIYVSLVLSELRKAGWLEIKINPQDARRRIYTLFEPEEVVKKIEVTA